MEFSGSGPASDIKLSEDDCDTVPAPNGQELVCVGQCVVDSGDASVASYQ